MDKPNVPAPKRRNWVKLLGLIFGILLLLVVVLYFVATSSGFIRSVILPRVSKSIGAEVTASDVSLSPFKQIILKDLKVQPPGRDPLFTAPEVIVKYRLMDILRGDFVIDLVSAASPVVSLVERPDATSNLDPVMEALGETEDEPMNLDLKKLTIRNGTIRYEQQPSTKGSSLVEIAKLDVNIDNLKTEAVGKVSMNGLLTMRTEAPAPGTNAFLAGTIKGELDLGLTPMLMPNVLKGSTRLDITEAKEGFAMASGMALVFEADVTPADVKQLALRLVQGPQTIGELAASGPFSIEKLEGTLDVRVSNIDRHALNLFTAESGMDFGKTSISSTNRIQLSKGGEAITASGTFLVNNLQVTLTNQTTPVLTFSAAYDASVDQAASNAVIRALTLNGTQEGRAFLKGALTAPMVVNWGGTDQAVGDSAFVLTVDQFNLGAWKAFTGEALESGIVNSKVEVVSKQSGKQIAFNHKSGIENLGILTGSNRISRIAVSLSGEGEALDMEQFKTRFAFDLSQAAARALQATGSATYDAKTEQARGDVKGSASIPQLLRIASIEDTDFSSGAAQFNLAFEQKGDTENVQGDFNLQNLTGRLGSNVFQNFAATSSLDVAMDEHQATIRKARIELAQAGKPGGTVDISGTVGLSDSTAKIKMLLKDLNQNVLSTFLQPAMGEKKLASISLNGQSTVDYAPEKPSSITADFKMSNFVVQDPTGGIPATPLEAGFALHTTLDKNIAEVKKGVLTLTPTQRAKNELQITGRVDMSDTNFASGNLTIQADSLDLTTYYNIFQGQETAEQASEPTPSQPSPGQPGAKPQPEQEAEPMILPMTNFLVQASIQRFYLSELEITNLVANTRIDGGRVQLAPFHMAINGAPLALSANVDMGIPGYRYDVSFGMTNVPFAPLVNTFTPERKGQLGGVISATTQVKGAGTTMASLEKNLNGFFSLETTNLNFDISQVRSPMLQTVINVISILPSIIKNPDSAGLSSLAGALLGGGAASSGAKAQDGGWGNKLKQSPIDVIAANAKIGSGVAELQRAIVQSRAFIAEAQGTIELNEVLTNSTVNIPLSVALSRSLAEEINMLPPNTPTNVAYVKLPNYVTMRGTIGEPKTDINAKALIGTALQQFGGNIPGVDEKTSGIIQGLGGILTGRRGDTNAPATTNAPPAQTNRSGGLLQDLGNILGGGTTQTNQGSTNSPVTNSPAGNLLEGIFGPRKR